MFGYTQRSAVPATRTVHYVSQLCHHCESERTQHYRIQKIHTYAICNQINGNKEALAEYMVTSPVMVSVGE